MSAQPRVLSPFVERNFGGGVPFYFEGAADFLAAGCDAGIVVA